MDGSLHARVSSGAAHAGFVRHRHMSVSDKDVWESNSICISALLDSLVHKFAKGDSA